MKENVTISSNIFAALDEVKNSFLELANKKVFVKPYKSIVINLHNSLELIFKFMIQNRNEFMLFKLENIDFDKLASKYKLARQAGYVSLIKYSDEKGEALPHTITFKNSYKILAYLYGVVGFNEKFIVQLEMLENLRNGFTHYTCKICSVDLVIFKELYLKAIGLYNDEIENFSGQLKMVSDKEKLTQYSLNMINNGLWKTFLLLCDEVIEQYILNSDICKIMIGGFVDGRNNEFIEVSISDRDNIINILYDLKENEFKKVLPKTKKENIIKEINKWLDYMIAAEVIEDRNIIVDQFGTAFLGSIAISDKACDLIYRLFKTEIDIKKALFIDDVNSLRWDMDYCDYNEE